MRAGLVAAALAVGLGPVSPIALPAEVAVASAVAPTDTDCGSVTADTEDARTVRGPDPVLGALHIDEAARLVGRDRRAAGRGVSVIVVDSGITGYDTEAPSPLRSGHGLAVAGIIAGPDQRDPKVEVGIAPGARLVDRPFYTEQSGEGDEVVVPMARGLAAALDAIPRPGARTVVLVPAQVPASDALEQSIARLTRAGALVIAASGDRLADASGPLKEFAGDGARPGEDAAGLVWPAADPDVLAVGVSAPDSSAAVLRNTDIDVAAPGVSSVARGLNGGWCLVDTVSTHWAAAQVAGVAALVWSAHPDESAAQIRERLEGTATGTAGEGGGTSPLVGHGVVQPVEAIQADLAALGDDMGERETVPRGIAPTPAADTLAPTRDRAIWWGIAGGGALLVLLILRPALSRRR